MGVIGLEGIGRPIAKGGVLPIVVVDRLQEVWEVGDDVGYRPVAARKDLFVLECLHEAFRVRVDAPMCQESAIVRYAAANSCTAAA